MTYIEESNDSLNKQIESERAEKQTLQKELEETRNVVNELNKKAAKARISSMLITDSEQIMSAPNSPLNDGKANETDKLAFVEKHKALLLEEFKKMKTQHEVTLKDLEKE